MWRFLTPGSHIPGLKNAWIGPWQWAKQQALAIVCLIKERERSQQMSKERVGKSNHALVWIIITWQICWEWLRWQTNMSSESSHIFWLSRVQAPLQTFLRPGIWIPGARTPHYYRETWIIEDSPENTYQDIIQAIESVQLRKKWQIRKTDEEQLFIQVLAFTPYCNWLDILEIQFDTSLTQSGM